MLKRTRFAPSPTGLLHIGNAYSALQCEQWAKEQHAELYLRIEDIDFSRCRDHFCRQMLDDLSWLGIAFDGEVIYQQQRLAHYQHALAQLIDMDVLYPCFCTRKQIQASINPNQHNSLDHYPYTCRYLNKEEQQQRMSHEPFSWRLHQEKAAKIMRKMPFWLDFTKEKHAFSPQSIGDVIIGRKDITYSYHLSMVVDDHLQHISHVIRGEDLRSSTPVHHILQALLGYASPLYHHHTLILDDHGQRFAKTKQSTSLTSWRESGMTANQLRHHLQR